MAGAGILVAGFWLGYHAAFGYFIILLPLLLLPLGLLARLPRSLNWLSGLLAVLALIQPMLLWGKHLGLPLLAALHPVNALLLFALVPTMAAAYGAAVVLGIGFGAYQAVDFAMITQVLPAARDRGKDLGVINIANAMPQVLAPAFAAGVLAVGLGYRGLYILAAGVSVLGSVLVVRIRSLA